VADSLPDDWEDGADDWEEAPAGVGAGVAAARGAASGATAGFADEAIGWLESTFPRLSLSPGDFLDPTVPTPEPRTYQQARDDYRGVQRQTREAQPAAYIAGEVGGSIAGAKGLGAAGQGYRGAVALGAASGLGNSEAELAQPTVSGVGTATTDTLKGAAFGVAGQFVGEQAGRAVPALARRLVKPTEDFAAMRALNAAGYFKNELKPIIRDGGKERAVRMGLSSRACRRLAASGVRRWAASSSRQTAPGRRLTCPASPAASLTR
jgi:hypothetical protein